MEAPSLPAAAAERPAWRVLLPLCLVVFAVLVHGSAIGPLAREMARDLGTTIPLIGQVTTLLLGTMAVAGLSSARSPTTSATARSSCSAWPPSPPAPA